MSFSKLALILAAILCRDFAVIFAIFTNVCRVFTVFCRDFLLSLIIGRSEPSWWRNVLVANLPGVKRPILKQNGYTAKCPGSELTKWCNVLYVQEV